MIFLIMAKTKVTRVHWALLYRKKSYGHCVWYVFFNHHSLTFVPNFHVVKTDTKKDWQSENTDNKWQSWSQNPVRCEGQFCDHWCMKPQFIPGSSWEPWTINLLITSFTDLFWSWHNIDKALKTLKLRNELVINEVLEKQQNC